MVKIKNVLLCLMISVVLLWAERIVTLGPAVTNQILLLGSGDEIVGKTSYCDSTAGIPGEVSVVGSLLSLSLESVAALKPTVIFASGLTPEPIKNKFKTMGFKLISIDDPKSFDHLCDNFKTIAEVLDKNETADSILTEVNLKYSTLYRSVKGRKAKRLFFELGVKPVYSVVKGSLGDELITLIGGENIFSLTRSGEVSREAVLKSDPEVILISAMGDMSESEVQRWKTFPTLSAVKNDAVFIVDAYAVGSPTPVSFLETVEQFRVLTSFDNKNEK